MKVSNERLKIGDLKSLEFAVFVADFQQPLVDLRFLPAIWSCRWGRGSDMGVCWLSCKHTVEECY